MNRSALLVLFLSLAGASPASAAPGMDQLRRAAADGEAAARGSMPEAASQASGQTFDWSSVGGEAVPTDPGPAGGVKPPDATLKPGGKRPDLFVGKPQRLGEPDNPLDSKDKPKDTGSGTKLWWALGGAALGGLLGFLFGGPIGAAIGAAVGAAAGWYLSP